MTADEVTELLKRVDELLPRIEYALMGWVIRCPQDEVVEANTLIQSVRDLRNI